MGGSIEYVWRDGSRLTPWMLYVITVLDAELWRLFGVHVIVTSAIRLHQEQINIFLDRYRVQWVGKGKYGDVRWWKGKRYVRVSGAGTVAPPGKSNHEIQGGSTAAFDLRDTGRDAGITVKNSVRGRWFREVFMPKWGMDPEGDGFQEGWHSRIRNIFRTPPASAAGGNAKPIIIPAPEPEEEDDNMRILGYKNPADGRTWYAQFDTTSGFWSEFVTNDEDYARAIGAKWTADGIPLVSEGHRNDLKAECDRISGRVKS